MGRSPLHTSLCYTVSLWLVVPVKDIDENGLQFLGKSYRKAHKLGTPRQKREWWFPKYMGSLQVLSEVERSLYGEAYMGTLSNVLSAVFGGETVTASDGSSVTHVLMSY